MAWVRDSLILGAMRCSRLFSRREKGTVPFFLHRAEDLKGISPFSSSWTNQPFLAEGIPLALRAIIKKAD